MSQALSRSARRVQAALDERGYAFQIQELPDSTRTAVEAARAVGCDVAQIAKSLVFRGGESGAALLVIASGGNRVSEALLAELAGEPIRRADAAFVREQTGFAIGGVPPVGHARSLRTWIDPGLLGFEHIWAAAGTPRAVFRLPPGALVELTGGQVADVTED